MSQPLCVGKIVSAARGGYRLISAIKRPCGGAPTSFKARCTFGAHEGTWVTVKSLTLQRRRQLQCEWEVHHSRLIQQSPWIRQLLDVAGDPRDPADGGRMPPRKMDAFEEEPPCLVFEWMDCSLGELDPAVHTHNHALHKAIFEAGLRCLITLDHEELVHMKLKPENILVSGADTPSPTVKIAGLSEVTEHGVVLDYGRRVAIPDPDGRDGICFVEVADVPGRQPQTRSMRAPEVWLGRQMTHRSDVWSLAAAVLAWLRPGLLGPGGARDGLGPAAWSLGKLMRLFPEWDKSTRRGSDPDFWAALAISAARDPDMPGTAKGYVGVDSLNAELRATTASDELKAMLRYLLVPNECFRPYADAALDSAEYRALLRKAKAHR